MKKFLNCSALAGLMICIPTFTAFADGYEPYSWDDFSYSSNSAQAGTPTTWSHMKSLITHATGNQQVLTIDIDTAIGDNLYLGDLIDAFNSTVWVWNGTGAPADYEEVAAVQNSASLRIGITGYAAAQQVSWIYTNSNPPQNPQANVNISSYPPTNPFSDLDMDVDNTLETGQTYLEANHYIYNYAYTEAGNSGSRDGAYVYTSGITGVHYIID
jgi:hypothetical protein